MKQELIKIEEGVAIVTEKTVETIKQIENTIEQLQAVQKNYKEQLLQEMENKDIIKIENDNMIITRIEDSESEYFNKTQFKKEHQELHDSYISMRKRKGYIRLTIKKEQEQE